MNFNFGGPRKGPRGRQTPDSSVSLTIESPSPPPSDNWEAVDLSSTEYARRRRELMQLIGDLRSLGGEALLDLPSIVVIGGQSAGKSSLVEAVSGVNVPRDSGTCTRCPIECTMSSNVTAWSCRIRLRFDYDSSGYSVAQQKEIAFGPTITDKNEVDIWLRRAQTAILNPHLPPESFHKQGIEDLRNFTSTNSLKFSRNVISIFLEDPTATDLSFVDLPGLIQNEDQGVLDLVRQLTESYISRPNTIILTTIPMSDDMQNQQSVRLAREADPDGERTIGILTKPDTLGEGAVNARKLWLDVIEGRQHSLKHGYYCVRLPDDTQRAQRLSRSAFQHIAAEFFDTTSPWNEVADRGRFGIPAFVSDISVLLVNHINRVIPQLKQDVERLVASCLEDINALPKPLEDDPRTEVLARVNAFCDAFKGVVSGASSDKSLAQRNIAHYTIFAQHVRGTSPDFRPFEDPTEYSIIDALESEEPAVVRNAKVKTMGVYDVRKTIKESIAWELPGNIPYEAKTRLISRSTALWFAPADTCLASVNDVLDRVIQQLVETHFGRFKVLRNLISDLIRPDFEEHKQRALTAINETLELEISPNYTQNLKDYQNLREKWLAKYRYARKYPGEYRIYREPTPEPFDCPSPPPAMDPVCTPKAKAQKKGSIFSSERDSITAFECVPSPKTPAQQALHYLAEIGYRGLTVEDLTRLCPRDQFEDELIVMADVRAYFTIAYKRIIDHVPLKIEHCLHQALAERLSVSLLRRLIVDTTSTGDFADRMKELVAEDPAIEEKRRGLEAKRTRLQEMRRRLLSLTS